jgi:hypothetical protein
MQMFPISKARLSFLLIVCSVFSIAYPQNASEQGVKYTPEFKFKEGVFLNFDQVKQNAPILKSRIITNIAYDDADFFERILKEKKIQLFDNLGVKQEVSTKNIWGFSRNGVLYVSMNGNYFRITIIGNICHFVASQVQNRNDYMSPYYYGYPYYNPYNPYYAPARSQDVELKQYLLDFKTGNLLEYDEESVELLLMADPELHDEFASLNNKKRKQLKFLYIRKFNEKNPLYFPAN